MPLQRGKLSVRDMGERVAGLVAEVLLAGNDVISGGMKIGWGMAAGEALPGLAEAANLLLCDTRNGRQNGTGA